MESLVKATRIQASTNSIQYVRFFNDFSIQPITNVWTDTTQAGFVGDKIYVVQTLTKVIERCILMTTDPGDLVLDPTCGSGTTAYVAEQWGRRWITVDTSRVSLALARARIMGARYPYYLLADSKAGQEKEAAVTRTAIADAPTYDNIRQGFVYERVPHIMLSSISNNTEIDTIWEQFQPQVEQALADLNTALKGHSKPYKVTTGGRDGKKIDFTASGTVKLPSGEDAPANALLEWEVPREAPADWPQAAQAPLEAFWKARIARQKEIDASIAAKADQEYLYDKPYEDKNIVRVAGPFTVESLSPHRVLVVDENDELVESGQWSVAGEDSDQRLVVSGSSRHPSQATSHQSPNTGEADFADVILETLKTAGVQQAHKEDKINFTSITGWPGQYICAEGRFEVDSDQWLADSGGSGRWPVSSGQKVAGDQWPVASEESASTSDQSQTTSHKPLTTKRAGIFIGPEFGTVSRADLIAAAREAGDARFDVLISCAFSYDAHCADTQQLGRVRILKARMNADLHMADTLKNTGTGNLFVIFGEPDMDVMSGQWLVTSTGQVVVNYDIVAELSGLGSLAEINRLGREDLPSLQQLSPRREVRSDESTSTSGGVSASQHRGGSSPQRDGGVSSISEYRQRVTSGSRNAADSGAAAGVYRTTDGGTAHAGSGHHWSHAQRTQAIAAIETLTPSDFPLSLTTDHYTQVTIHGIDVFHPQSGEVRSSSPDEIACWFIDTDYNEESFFVRHAYFLGASDPYKALKTTLKAEIDAAAWESLYGDTSRPFPKPPLWPHRRQSHQPPRRRSHESF